MVGEDLFKIQTLNPFGCSYSRRLTVCWILAFHINTSQNLTKDQTVLRWVVAARMFIFSRNIRAKDFHNTIVPIEARLIFKNRKTTKIYQITLCKIECQWVCVYIWIYKSILGPKISIPVQDVQEMILHRPFNKAWYDRLSHGLIWYILWIFKALSQCPDMKLGILWPDLDH